MNLSCHIRSSLLQSVHLISSSNVTGSLHDGQGALTDEQTRRGRSLDIPLLTNTSPTGSCRILRIVSSRGVSRIFRVDGKGRNQIFRNIFWEILLSNNSSNMILRLLRNPKQVPLDSCNFFSPDFVGQGRLYNIFDCGGGRQTECLIDMINAMFFLLLEVILVTFKSFTCLFIYIVIPSFIYLSF